MGLLSPIQNGCTALTQASFNGHQKVVELLLRAGENPNLQDEVMMSVYPLKQGAVLRASPQVWCCLALQS